MAQEDMDMTAQAKPSKFLRLALGGVAFAALMTSGTVVGKASPAEARAQLAQQALAKGKVDRAIGHAEEAVTASPRDPAMRLVLAQAYLKAGRFESAAATFNDAMELGDTSPRTALSLALANVAAGRRSEAVAVLDDWRDAIPVSDLGLAYALAGETSRGTALLADALRGGENTPKLRQNLAYAYALDGRWREARTMAAQDVPANQIDARISDWAENARPEDYHRRVAALLSVPYRADPGQPTALALNAGPAEEQLASEAAAEAPSSQLAAAELPAGAAPATEVPATESPRFAEAFQQPAYTSQPVVQPLPARAVRTASAPARAAPVRAVPRRADGAPVADERPVATGGTHMVQLGSFSSEQGARRAWGIFAAKNPELKNFRMTITPATVRGRNFWRVAAAGLDAGGARGLCSSVKGRGGACFAYAAINPPAGAVPGQGQSGPQRARR
jgi:Flp pilus assembly protein TadD